MEVERVSDDPPQRVAAWLATVDDEALGELDINLLLDLLRIEIDVEAWSSVATIVVTEIEQRTQRGQISGAQRLAFALVAETGSDGRATLRSAARSAVEALAEGPLAKHLATSLRTAADSEVDTFDRLCRTLGPPIIGPLAEALMTEDNGRAIRRLREILILFGAAGRETVERLKRSPKATVRRTAIEMLRLFGGPEALADLSAMLDDRDPQVQRDAIRAIVQIGNDDAFAVLHTSLTTDAASSGSITKQLISLREVRTVPLLCHILERSKPRGRAETHTQIMEALGALGPHAESIKTLRAALYRGEWWSPSRTAALRRAAALALWRIGSPEALHVIEDAARTGGRRVRSAARIPAGVAPRREREQR
jgi:HEAT repeat protein